jgi:catechol 2,3-dioxygenase-like lactoylglutathione lyase family enzyme
MIQVTGFDHIVLRVRDLERMAAFYGDVLGMKVAHRQDDLGLVHLRAGPSLLDLVAIDGPLGRQSGSPGGPGLNLDHFCLNVADFDLARVRAHLEAHGVEIGEDAMRYGAAGQGLSLYLKDPEGNALELRG